MVGLRSGSSTDDALTLSTRQLANMSAAAKPAAPPAAATEPATHPAAATAPAADTQSPTDLEALYGLHLLDTHPDWDSSQAFSRLHSRAYIRDFLIFTRLQQIPNVPALLAV